MQNFEGKVFLSPFFVLHHDYPEAKRLESIPNPATNPTVIHEAYHTLVYAQKWDRKEAIVFPFFR